MDEKHEPENLIFSYTRKQAIEDGVLIDVSETTMAREAGFKIPVALTIGINNLVKVPEDLTGIQNYEGRLWDTLFLAAHAFVKFKGDRHLVPFNVIYQISKRRRKEYVLWLAFNEHEGFTIMLPEEY